MVQQSTPLSIDVELLCQAFVIDSSSPSGLRRVVNGGRRAKAGDVAGCLNNKGYYLVMFQSKRYLSHRIVWAIYNRKDPGHLTIDHIDGNRLNNHPDNLRLATMSGQNRNRKDMPSKFGRGVAKDGNRYKARIRIDGKRMHLGTFDTPEEAQAAHRQAHERILSNLSHILYPDV